MTALSDYCERMRAWIDDEDLTDEEITEWVRDAEERINNELRTTEQVVRTYATFDDNCAVLPPDWLEHIYIRVKGGRPFNFVTNDDYWKLQRPPSYSMQPDPTGGEVYPWPGRKQHYTMIGTTMFVWPPINPDALTQVEIAYYRKVKPLGDDVDAVQARYPSIYRYCTMVAGSAYGIEDERVPLWAGMATAAIKAANEATKKSRHSGSPIAPAIRSFG